MMDSNVDFPATDAYKRGEVSAPWVEAAAQGDDWGIVLLNNVIARGHKTCCSLMPLWREHPRYTVHHVWEPLEQCPPRPHGRLNKPTYRHGQDTDFDKLEDALNFWRQEVQKRMEGIYMPVDWRLVS